MRRGAARSMGDCLPSKSLACNARWHLALQFHAPGRRAQHGRLSALEIAGM